MESLNLRLRKLFEDFKLYTVDELVELTGSDKRVVQAHISKLKNDKYCGKFLGRLDLVQDIGYYDGLKRWGLRGATKLYTKES